MQHFLKQRLGPLLLFGAAYAAAIQLSFLYVVEPEGISTIWIPAGLLLGMLLRTEIGDWPWIVGTAAVVGVASGLRHDPWMVVVIYILANMTEAVISASLIAWAVGLRSRLDRLNQVFAIALFPSLVGQPVSAFLAAYGQTRLLGAGDFWHGWAIWWSASTLGEILIVPLVLTMPSVRRRSGQNETRALVELAVTTVAVAALSLFIFASRISAHTGPLFGWLTFPVIALTAVRLGPIGAAFSAAAYGLVAAWSTVHGTGPFAMLGGGAGDRTLWLNLFLGFTVFAALTLAAADAEYRRAAIALGESEKRYRSIFEGALDAIFRTTPDGRYADANPAAARMLGYESPEQLKATVKNVTELYADPRQREDVLARLYADGKIPAIEVAMRRRDGTVGWLSMSLQLIRDERGTVTFVEGVAEDVTERKSREEEADFLQRQLLQAQKMEALGTLAGGIAHDFNNILAAIVGMIDLASLSLAPDHPARRYVDDAMRAAERAGELVQHVLTFSKQHDDSRTLESLAPIANEAARFMRAALPSSVSIRTDVPNSLPPVLANATQIRQVLVNLMTNAGQAMHDHGGTLALTLDEVRPDEALRARWPKLRDVDYVRITVADTGQGMDAVTMRRIFEPFFTTKHPGEGTGLGLAMVHGIVERHDGAITVESEPNMGATFQVYLPALAERSPEVNTRQEVLARGRGERVLFIDDEPMLARVGDLFLTDLGYRVRAFKHASEALAAFTATPDEFDIVITDLTMPDASGLEIADEVRALRPEIAIILTTGFRGSLTNEIIAAHGIRAVVTKPYSGAHLATTLRQVLDARD